jgi:hypothetical protein
MLVSIRCRLVRGQDVADSHVVPPSIMFSLPGLANYQGGSYVTEYRAAPDHTTELSQLV